MYKVLGKKDCSFCERTKKLLKTFNIPFVYAELDKEFTLEEFKKMIPSYHNSFPAIYKGETWDVHPDDTFVGGFTELKKTVFK